MEALRPTLQLIGALVMALSGLAGLIAPARIANALSIELPDPRGRAEVRIGLGGAFFGLGLWALIAREPAAYYVVGAAWLGAAMTRLLAYQLDRPKLDGSYLGIFFLELVMGLFLII